MSSDRKIDDELLKIVTRVEMIDESGRAYVNTSVKKVELHFQDDGRTLKLFIETAHNSAG